MAQAGVYLSIREFEPADLPRLHEIRSRAFAPVFSSFRSIVGDAIAPCAFSGEEARQGEHLEELCGDGDNSQVYVAVVEDAIVVFVAVALHRDTSVGEIGLNAVDPAQSGSGVGSALYRFALGKMREAGMKVAMVGTGGDPSHEPARRA